MDYRKTAQEIYDGLYAQSQNYADSVSQYGLLPEFYDDDAGRYGYQYERPDFLEYLVLRIIGRYATTSHPSGGNYDFYNHSTGEERHKLIRDINFPMETAVLFYDADGNLLHSSESDILYFNYYTQEEWDGCTMVGSTSAKVRKRGILMTHTCAFVLCMPVLVVCTISKQSV